tara:strand:+ start:407 stop:919 length:513 start_codon:yes stop_codon:yes gene_type:complete
MVITERQFRLLDFNIYDYQDEDNSFDSIDEESERKDNRKFMIQIFAINEKGETVSLYVKNYKPFFYIKVSNEWTENTKKKFLNELKDKLGNYYKDSIKECDLVEKKKLYEFDGGKLHKFVYISFNNTVCYNRIKNLYYENCKKRGRILKKMVFDFEIRILIFTKLVYLLF